MTPMKPTTYRLVKKTRASGYIQWNIEKKVLWWWEFVDGFYDERKARATLERLREGTPDEVREIAG